jgi:hypothetical protein
MTAEKKRFQDLENCLNISDSVLDIVTCIARQQTDKHLEMEYTHATIE